MSDFEDYRGLLFSIGYQMTGSAADAEDLVQDAWVRFASVDREVVRDVKAFLVTILTRLALDRLRSARVQREEYIGPWLPEPVLTGIDGDPFARVTRDQKVEMALLRTLDRLTPQERAVFLLREILDDDHREIADLLGITPVASRQLLHRAKQRVSAEKVRSAPPPATQRHLVERFMGALARRDAEELRSVLKEDVVAVSDGGGKVFAAKREVSGAAAVARMFIGIVEKFGAGVSAAIEEVNGAPAIVGRLGGEVRTILTFVFDGEGIAEIATIVNPDKLAFAGRQ